MNRADRRRRASIERKQMLTPGVIDATKRIEAARRSAVKTEHTNDDSAVQFVFAPSGESGKLLVVYERPIQRLVLGWKKAEAIGQAYIRCAHLERDRLMDAAAKGKTGNEKVEELRVDTPQTPEAKELEDRLRAGGQLTDSSVLTKAVRDSLSEELSPTETSPEKIS